MFPSRTVLNICFPYTSRAEITTAIRNTVEDFLDPPPPKNTPFSPSRIRQKILSTQLDGKDPLPTIHDDIPNEAEAETAAQDVDEDAGSSSSTTLPPGSPSPRLRTYSSSSATNLPSPEAITTETLNDHMYTSQDPPLELFVRTSGVERLSDFMLWQCHQDTQIFFIDCLWPDFDLQHFIWVMLEWQWRQKQKERDATSTLVKGKSRRLVE